jgi:hypothetical protein
MRRTRTGCLWMMIKPVLMVALVLGCLAVMAFPWAIPMPGRETLSGRWVGELRSNRGPRAWLFINLRSDSTYRAPIFGFITGRGAPLGGTAALCATQRRFEFVIAGNTTVWSGKELDILLKPVRPSPPDLRLGVRGEWDGHTLELREMDASLADILGEPGPPAAVETQNGHAWVSARLNKRPESEFTSACSTLR